jgi:hypothetical protein
LVLSIPTRAQQGDRLRVTGAFTPPDPWQDEWTFRRAVAPGDTEIGFARTRATIPNPPYNYPAIYTATRATGTVEVTGRERGRLDLRVDLTAVDETGRAYRIAGTVGIKAAKEGEACPTLS